MREQLVRLVKIIPVEFIVRNIATGSLTKKLGISDGTVLSRPLVEYSYKNDELGDPLVAREHIIEFKWATNEELDFINDCCLRINDFMQGMFRGVGIKLVDIKVEFLKTTIDDKKEILIPDVKNLDDEKLAVHCKKFVKTNYHPSGTAKMGADGDKMAVLDAKMRVRGIENLRVCDLSVVPNINSGNTSAPAIMLGLRCGDLINNVLKIK